MKLSSNQSIHNIKIDQFFMNELYFNKYLLKYNSFIKTYETSVIVEDSLLNKNIGLLKYKLNNSNVKFLFNLYINKLSYNEFFFKNLFNYKLKFNKSKINLFNLLDTFYYDSIKGPISSQSLYNMFTVMKIGGDSFYNNKKNFWPWGIKKLNTKNYNNLESSKNNLLINNYSNRFSNFNHSRLNTTLNKQNNQKLNWLNFIYYKFLIFKNLYNKNNIFKVNNDLKLNLKLSNLIISKNNDYLYLILYFNYKFNKNQFNILKLILNINFNFNIFFEKSNKIVKNSFINKILKLNNWKQFIKLNFLLYKQYLENKKFNLINNNKLVFLKKLNKNISNNSNINYLLIYISKLSLNINKNIKFNNFIKVNKLKQFNSKIKILNFLNTKKNINQIFLKHKKKNLLWNYNFISKKYSNKKFYQKAKYLSKEIFGLINSNIFKKNKINNFKVLKFKTIKKIKKKNSIINRKFQYSFKKKFIFFSILMYKFKKVTDILNNINYNIIPINDLNNIKNFNFISEYWKKKVYTRWWFRWWDNYHKLLLPYSINRILIMSIKIKKNNTFITFTNFMGKILYIRHCGHLKETQRRYRNTFTANERLSLLAKKCLLNYFSTYQFSKISNKDKQIFRKKKLTIKFQKSIESGKTFSVENKLKLQNLEDIEKKEKEKEKKKNDVSKLYNNWLLKRKIEEFKHKFRNGKVPIWYIRRFWKILEKKRQKQARKVRNLNLNILDNKQLSGMEKKKKNSKNFINFSSKLKKNKELKNIKHILSNRLSLSNTNLKIKQFDGIPYDSIDKKKFLLVKMNFGFSPAKCLHVYRKFKRNRTMRRLPYKIFSLINITNVTHNGLRGKKLRRKKSKKNRKKI